MVEVASQAFVRRRAARLPVHWPALWYVGMGRTWHAGTIVDVSPFGAFVRLEPSDEHKMPEHGESLSILIEVNGEPFLIEGVVRWAPPGGVGIAFSPEYGVVCEARAWELAERSETRPVERF